MLRPTASIPRRSRLDLPVESFLRPGVATAAIYPRQEEVREIIVLRNPDGTLPQSTFGDASAAQRRPAPVMSTQRTATERKPIHDPIAMLSNRVAAASADLKKRPVPQPSILDRFETAELPAAWQDTQPPLYTAEIDHLPAPSGGMWHDARYLRKAHDRSLAWLKQRRVRARELALGIAEPTTAFTPPPQPSCGLSRRTSRPTSASTTRHAPSPGASLLPSSHASAQPSRQPSYPPSCQPSRKPSRPSSAHAYAGGAGAARVAPTRPSSAGAYVAPTRPSPWPVSSWPVSACPYVGAEMGAEDADAAATAASVPAFCVAPDAPEIVKHVTGLEPRPRPRRRPASASAARIREWSTERPEPLAMATPRRPPSADAGPRMPAPLMYRISYSRPPKYSFAFPPPEDISDALLAASHAALLPATSKADLKVDLAAHYERAPGHLGARDGADALDRNVPSLPPSAHPTMQWDGTASLHSNVLVPPPPKYRAGGAASSPTEALDVLADALEWATPAALEVQSGSSRHLIATSRHDALPLPIGSGTTGGNAVVFLPLASSGDPPAGSGGTGTSASGAAAELEALHAVADAADGGCLDAQAVPHSPRPAQ